MILIEISDNKANDLDFIPKNKIIKHIKHNVKTQSNKKCYICGKHIFKGNTIIVVTTFNYITKTFSNQSLCSSSCLGVLSLHILKDVKESKYNV